MKRGVNSYIEDRVDLTLLEIQAFYDLIQSGEWDRFFAEQRQKGKCESLVINSSKDWENIKEWLNHFGSFENYVDFFAFHAFVDVKDGYKVIDITSKNKAILKPWKELLYNENQEDVLKDKMVSRIKWDLGFKISKMKKEELDTVIKNIIELIETRTNQMIDIIENK